MGGFNYVLFHGKSNSEDWKDNIAICIDRFDNYGNCGHAS
jgi:hypothetical protein